MLMNAVNSTIGFHPTETTAPSLKRLKLPDPRELLAFLEEPRTLPLEFPLEIAHNTASALLAHWTWSSHFAQTLEPTSHSWRSETRRR